MSVTATEAGQTVGTTVSVTRPMALRNDQLSFADDGSIVSPRWIAVNVWTDELGRHYAEPTAFRIKNRNGVVEPMRVLIATCGCAREWATGYMWPYKRIASSRCEKCWRMLRRRAQSRRRARRRVMASQCANCQMPMSAARSSKRFCSARCRVTAFRSAERKP
jgi:hypothetical protein